MEKKLKARGGVKGLRVVFPTRIGGALTHWHNNDRATFSRKLVIELLKTTIAFGRVESSHD